MLYAFGPFRLDPAERILRRNGQTISLTPKAFDTLVVLVERDNRVVEKEELLERVWPDTFVEEATLTQNISTLRKVLGDATEASRYIETVPKVGYRFIQPVQRLEMPPGAARAAAARAPRRGLWWSVTALGLLIVMTGYFLWKRDGRPGPTGKLMLVVMPFENLSGDPGQEYLADGLTEEMITQLGSLNPERLGVIARTTAMSYRGSQKSVAEIGRELGMDYLLEGSVRHEGSQIRISAQLIDVRDQTHIWAESYDRDARDMLVVENEVAGAIASSVEIRLTPATRARLAATHRVDPMENELYLKGRYFWNQRNGESTDKARDYFRRAIHLDPSDARSYAGLAETYAGANWPEMQAVAAPAVARALALDNTLADAHISNALLKMYGYDWEGAENEFRRTLILDPNSVVARLFHAQRLQATGQNDEAIAEVDRAVAIDPLSVLANQAAGSALFYARRYDASRNALMKTIELAPDFSWAHLRLARVYIQQGRFPEAEAELLKIRASSPGIAGILLGQLYALEGKKDEALAQVPPNADSSGFEAVLIFAALGDKSHAFATLEQCVKDHDVNVIYLKVEPGFDSLRGDSRFALILRMAKLQ
jgi:TolB-like protein/DNA-binding winged helix-turn-helix (wHTH) protein/Tfp pilus assembly protein PilF